MSRIRLIHWNAGEAAERAARLEILGYAVDHLPPEGGVNFVRQLAENPPAAILIDLSRLPSQGRDMALNFRIRAGTRHVPLLFVGGDPAKVAAVRELLPDAHYTGWEQVGAALEDAIAHPPVDPIVPESVFGAYKGKPLAAKLGIKENQSLALVDAPQDFPATLGRLPDGVKLGNGLHAPAQVYLWFVRSQKELESNIESMAARIQQESLWIVWPKKASSLASDLTQQIVREAGLAQGLVDYKICSIDEAWSALLFTRRKK